MMDDGSVEALKVSKRVVGVLMNKRWKIVFMFMFVLWVEDVDVDGSEYLR